MNDDQHKKTAIEYHKRYWEIFTKNELSQDNKLELLDSALKSLEFWKLYSGCSILNEQRGEYLIGKAYLHLDDPENAIKYADSCLTKTLDHRDIMKDFDIAFAYELKAKAEKLFGATSKAGEYHQLAVEMGNKIKDKEDRDLFFEDFSNPV